MVFNILQLLQVCGLARRPPAKERAKAKNAQDDLRRCLIVFQGYPPCQEEYSRKYNPAGPAARDAVFADDSGQLFIVQHRIGRRPDSLLRPLGGRDWLNLARPAHKGPRLPPRIPAPAGVAAVNSVPDTGRFFRPEVGIVLPQRQDPGYRLASQSGRPPRKSCLFYCTHPECWL